MKTLLWLVCLLLTACKPPVPDGPDEPLPVVRYCQDLSMPSQVLGASLKYDVYLPASYNAQPEKRYPVVYLFHGYGDDHHSWNGQYLRLSSLVETVENGGQAGEFIYVMPQGYKTYYVNRYDGRYPYQDMLAQELIPYIDRTLRTLPDREHRAAIGYSMGGYGALIVPCCHPELFSVSVPLSMSFRTDAQYMTESAGGWDSQWGSIFGGKGCFGADRLTDYYLQHNPFYFFNETTAASYAGMRFWIDCGDDEEQLLVMNDTLHLHLRRLGIAHEYRVKNGAHTSSYWRDATKEALAFIDAAFNGRDYPVQDTVSVPDIHVATQALTLASFPGVEIAYPDSYEASAPAPLLYLLRDDRGYPGIGGDVLKLLRHHCPKAVIVSMDASAGIDMAALLRETEALVPASNRCALAYGEGGHAAYDTPVADKPFKGLFLVEADFELREPQENVFHFLSVCDESRTAVEANYLYNRCHAGDIPFQYRVFNGQPGRESVLTAVSKASSFLHDYTSN